MVTSKKKRERPAPRYLVTTIPKVSRCIKCRRVMLSAYVFGDRITIDPQPVNLRAEAMALIMGIGTYEMSLIGKPYPRHRNKFDIRDGLPSYGRVHPQHCCGMQWTDPQYRDSRKIFDYDKNAPCPF